MSEANRSFITLGRHLKYVRQQQQRSLAEVAGAVEIDPNTLQRIEAGEERPPEEILMLLISHYGVQDQEAVQLWELGEYEADTPDQIKADIELPANGKVIMLMAMDARTMYSDGLHIDINPAGLTMTFNQAAAKGQATPVARVGMSLEQAANVQRTLQQALLRAQYLNGPKKLPPSTKG
jgi:transcriptional regulator with XRE-family HTH domain